MACYQTNGEGVLHPPHPQGPRLNKMPVGYWDNIVPPSGSDGLSQLGTGSKQLPLPK